MQHVDAASASARFNLAVLMARESRVAEARALLSEALRISPAHEPSRALLESLNRASAR